jgi:DNA-binding response OmpR family regulator
MGGSVLLIDDDVDALRSIGNYFERLSYEVTRELSGEAGLATFDRLRPEVVFLDLFLPGMNGMEVLESLR